METLTKILAVVILTILWQIWFTIIDGNLTIKAKRKIQLQFNNNIHTALHGVICSWMGLTAILVCTTKQLNHKDSNTLDYIFLFSFSYFIVHSIHYIRYPFLQADFVLPHHIFATLFVGLFLFYEKKGRHFGMMGLVAGQLSALNLSLISFLRIFHMRYTKSFQIAQRLFMFIFLVARLTVLPYLAVYSILYIKLSWVTKFSIAFILVFSMEMNRRIVGVYNKNKKREKEMEEKNIQFEWVSEDRDNLAQLSFYQDY